MNGFGLIMSYIEPPNSLTIYDTYVLVDIILQVLMISLTLVEESTIDKITHILHIVKLTHDNYGTTGNTSLVWQKSKLNIMLPNLPETYKRFFYPTSKQIWWERKTNYKIDTP